MASVDIIFPVYNEEHVLAESVATLRKFLAQGFAHQYRIVVADNASTDGTLAVAQRLAEKHTDVASLHIPQKGRGRALRAAWLASPADVLSYMDVDLSTGLEAFPPLIKAIAEDGYGVATGSRLARKSKVDRSLKRTVLSRGYNLIIKAMMQTRFSDAQCGFKAISREVPERVLPLVQDNNWFFDTELLVLAEKMGYRIKDIPVRWVEDKDTRVKIGSTVSEDLRGLWRMRRQRPWRQSPPGSSVNSR
jgi:glycosyltransferase involved in cell wall biosynthesis